MLPQFGKSCTVRVADARTAVPVTVGMRSLAAFLLPEPPWLREVSSPFGGQANGGFDAGAAATAAFGAGPRARGTCPFATVVFLV